MSHDLYYQNESQKYIQKTKQNDPRWRELAARAPLTPNP
nr:MAG TPA: hypothetical protein [Caudoviricetes sp.]